MNFKGITVTVLKLLPPIARGRAIQTHAKLTRRMTVGVRGYICDEAGRILLIRQTYSTGWLLPGGGVERNETVLDAIQRELREEAQIEVTSARLTSIHANGSNHIAVFAIDTWISIAGSRCAEIAEIKWFAPHELPLAQNDPVRHRIEEQLGIRPLSSRW